jgi:hypothetical protein
MPAPQLSFSVEKPNPQVLEAGETWSDGSTSYMAIGMTMIPQPTDGL